MTLGVERNKDEFRFPHAMPAYFCSDDQSPNYNWKSPTLLDFVHIISSVISEKCPICLFLLFPTVNVIITSCYLPRKVATSEQQMP